MDQSKLVADIVRELDIPGGSTERRPVHTVGIGATGHFKPSPIAHEFCIAEHFTPVAADKGVPVEVRFSNGMGIVAVHDGWSDVRGMAVRFHLKEGRSTDLIAMTLPVFFAPTPDKFKDFAHAARPQPCRRETPWQKIKHYLNLELPMPDPYPGQHERPNEGAIAFADDHVWAQPAVLNASVIGAPVSYVRAAYHAVHTFIVTGRDRQKRWVRFAWAPVEGVLNVDRKHPPSHLPADVPAHDPETAPVDEYLQHDLGERLKNNKTARFSLMMHIGETGDDFNDSTRQWPPHRKRIMMGTLTLEETRSDKQEYFEKMSFNPCHLTDGIEPSDDPVLHIRKDVYAFSSDRRGGTPCPFFSSTKGKP